SLRGSEVSGHPATVALLSGRNALGEHRRRQIGFDAGDVGSDQRPAVEEHVDVVVSLNRPVKVFQKVECRRRGVLGPRLSRRNAARNREGERDLRDQLMVTGVASLPFRPGGLSMLNYLDRLGGAIAQVGLSHGTTVAFKSR